MRTIALDAATRGLVTALVEQYDFGLAREALCEVDLHPVLTRRTRVSIGTFDRGVGPAPGVARLMASVLGWDDDRVAREVVHCKARVTAEHEAQPQIDDLSADAARLGAPDVRAASRS